jgi:hypothetical protein
MTLIENKSKPIVYLMLFLLALVGVYSCDTLAPDVDPQSPEIEITGKEIHMVRNGSGVIDLYSMVRSSGEIRLDITGQPRKGNLSELSKGLLQYSPNTSFKKGRDFFEFAIYSQNNTLLKLDSVVIIIETDSTHLPCGFYPQSDSVYNVTGPVSIDVLNNDIICGDSTRVGVEIYRPDNSFPPSFGTATVQNNRIVYAPGSSFAGNDKIFYRIFSTQDTTKSGIGVVTILPTPPPPVCTFSLSFDNYVFDRDSLYSDTLLLKVFQNDQLCARAVNQYGFAMVNDGHVGTAHYPNAVDPSAFVYVIPDSAQTTFTDSLVYRLCYQARCQTATVYIKVKE